MNTFLTSLNDDVYAAARETGEQLDQKRRFKQIVEGMQLLILACRMNEPNNVIWQQAPFKDFALVSWKRPPIMVNHPCWKMWRYSPYALDAYIMGIADTWSGDTSSYEQREMLAYYIDYDIRLPSWWRSRLRNLFVEDCKRNLIRKDSAHYKYTVPDALGNEIPMVAKEGYLFPTDTKDLS